MAYRRLTTLLLALVLTVVAAGCAASGSGGGGDLGARTIRVTATTNIVTDLARVIGGDRVEVRALMGPGVDPHLFKASAGDVRTLREADVILYGGLELEGKMEDLLEEIGRTRPTVAVTRDMPRDRLLALPQSPGLSDPHVWFDVTLWRSAARTVAVTRDMPRDRLLALPQSPELSDPHVWFDVTLWRSAARTVADTYAELDPEHAGDYRARLAGYLTELDALDAYVRRQVATVPPRSRVLVTSHDAFRYFGAAYGVRVAAIQGTSTQTEATTADVERIAALIAERGLKAVFVESSVPRQTIEAVLASAAQRGQPSRVGGELYSDAAGDEGTVEGTYLGMVRHNVDLITGSLR